MKQKGTEQRLADRLGLTTHVSPLRHKLRNLMREFPMCGAETLEDWLLDVANVRGARVVMRDPMAPATAAGAPPPDTVLSNAELVTAICQPHNRDRPQWLRVAAQLITRGDVDIDELISLAKRERVGRILAELARQALQASPEHPVWSRLLALGEGEPALRDSLVHWTRLAEPVMRHGEPGAAGWRLVG